MIMHYNCRSSCTFASWFHTPLGTKMKEIKSKPAEANKSPGRNQSFPHHSLCHLACAWMEMEIEFYYVYKSKLWTFLCSSLSFGGCSRKKIFFFFPSSRSSSSSNRGDKIKLQCHHLLGWNQYGFPSPSSNILPERKADIIIAFFLTFSYRQSDCCSPQSQVINVDDDVRRESVGGKSGNKWELLNQKMKKEYIKKVITGSYAVCGGRPDGWFVLNMVVCLFVWGCTNLDIAFYLEAEEGFPSNLVW